jgi:ribosomal protein S18 acetylase RimI-like enzyme
MTDVTIRPGTDADLPVYQRVLYEALGWDPDQQLPSIEVVLAHPEVSRYHAEWGRPGDAGVVAEADGEPIGAAYFRLFTEEDHGDGYYDDRTPEIAIAVWGGRRGQGIGGRLLESLHEAGREAGFERLSLSVAADNAAVRLYERHGYITYSRDTSYRMLKELE